jgi:hypothetical protein
VGWNIIILNYILINLNDLKLGIQKYHLLLQLIIINNNSIFLWWWWWCGMPCVNNVLQLIVNFMTYNINFNKIWFIDCSKMFIMPKNVFYDLSLVTIRFNMIKEMINNVFNQQLIVNLMIHNINFNKITFIDWSKVFIIPKHVFYDLSYAIIMSNTIKEMIMNVFNN